MDPRIERIIETMHEELATSLSQEAMFKTVNLSAARGRALFKRETGLSPNQYLKQVRLNRAARLLTTSFLAVKEVMYMCGAKDASHFVHDFKKQFGVTPKEFRLRSQRSGKHPDGRN